VRYLCPATCGNFVGLWALRPDGREEVVWNTACVYSRLCQLAIGASSYIIRRWNSWVPSEYID